MHAGRKHRKWPALLPMTALALGLFAACADDENDPTATPQATATATTPAAGRPVVTLDGHDFSFAGPDTIESGWVDVTFNNVGQESHHAQFARLNDGETVDDVPAFFSSETPEGAPPFSEVGGVQAMGAHGSGVVTLDLKAGNYVAVCFIPDPETGQPHVALGMVEEFTVQ